MSLSSADYKWDVFFSYRRHPDTKLWIDLFLKKVSYWLSEELARPVKIFRDNYDIEVGRKWPDDLSVAVRSSKCMLGIFSPLYFESHWCRWEAGSFLSRGEFLKLDGTLIAPVRFHDGETFPPHFSTITMCDVREYAILAEPFWATSRVVELELKIKDLSRTLAGMIANAPKWQDDFPLHPMVTSVPKKRKSMKNRLSRL